jgi:hypothetical protein
MKAKLVLLLAASLIVWQARAEPIDVATLGQLELKYAAVAGAGKYAGQPLAAVASYRAGDAVSVVTVPRVQQIRYLLAPGASVTSGQRIAQLNGPEVHHFLTEYDVVGERLALAESRFKANRELYQRKAIDEGRWIEVSDTYYTLKLEHEHLRHFHELLDAAGDHGDPVFFTAPASGLLEYADRAGGIPSGTELARIIPREFLRLKIAVPVSRRGDLVSLSEGKCELAIAEISGIAEEFRVTAWSEAMTEACDYLPGQRLMVTPWYRGDGYRIPARSLMQWRGEPAVLVRRGAQLVPRTVVVLGGSGDEYFVACDQALEGNEVLITSVSAVQGILLGLGGE